MELHEYQIKSLLARFHVGSPPHILIDENSNIEKALSHFGFESLLIKAQVHGLGRKEGGGEQQTERPKEHVDAVKAILGKPIITSESGPKGFIASKVMVIPVPEYKKEYHVRVAVTCSGNVEVSASESKGKVFVERLFEGRIRPFQLHRLGAALGLHGDFEERFSKTVEGVVQAFFHFDALLLEIDPFVLTEEGIFEVLSCRMCIDDCALFRQPELRHLVDPAQVTPIPSTPPFACHQMGGVIGCLCNGVGLALATADLVQRFKGMPGSVVTIGSEVSEERLVAGLSMVQKNHRVIFLNLFTGLINGEKVAQVIKKQAGEVPIVVCLEGTNAAGGRFLLKDLVPRCIAMSAMDEAAKKAVAIASSRPSSQ